MSLIGRDVAVVGGGIGGLAAACALAQRGAHVTVHEQAAALGEVGAGIQISPNGLAVIDALGLGEALRAVALRAQAVDLRDGASGRSVLTLDLGRHGRGRTWLFVPRPRLVEVLAAGARAAGASLCFGQPVRSVTAASGAPEIHFGTGSRRQVSLVVGADGVRGAARPAVEGAAPPRFTGQVAWRAVVPGTASERAVIHTGPGRHMVTYPLPGERINIVAVEERTAWAEESWTAEDDPANLRTAFAGFAPEARDLVDRVERVNLWGLFRHPVAQRWHRGWVALVGDAAHPTLPFLAQGANLALEDAWALAACLGSDVEAPLEAYQRRRRARAVRVVAAADANARNYHLRPPLSTVAHRFLRLAGALAPARAVARFDWLYGHDETRLAP